MLVAEACLLQAVRDKLVTDLGLRPEQCDVELDDQLPAIAPKDYYAVTAAGTRPGPRHKSSGGVFDVTIDVKVTLFRRITEVARDRRRNVFLDLLKGTCLSLDRIVRSLDYNYELLTSAQTLVQAIVDADVGVPDAITANTSGQWPEPFRSFTPDSVPQMVYRDPYDAAQMAGAPADPIIALKRGVVFSGARYMQVRP